MANIKALEKLAKATPLTDSLGTILWSPFTPVTSIGTTAGMLTDDFKEQDDSALKAILPGVGAYRLGKRLSSQVKHEQEDARKLKRKDVSPVAHATAEGLGQITSLALPALAGGILLGSGGSERDRDSGAILGGAVGTAANLIGALAAAISRRRTKEEQMESDKKSVLWKYLVPGVASYDAFKRLGRSQGDRDEAEEESNSKKGKRKSKGD